MAIPVTTRPQPDEYAPYFDPYMKFVEETDIIAALENQIAEFQAVFKGQPDSMMTEVHEPYTWTINQALGHCIDTERIFAYRAARFAAGDQTELPGFDQDEMVANVDYSGVTTAQLLDELEHLRRSNLAMCRRFTDEQWQRRGTASGTPISTRAIVFLLVGHLRHHLTIFQRRLAA